MVHTCSIEGDYFNRLRSLLSPDAFGRDGKSARLCRAVRDSIGLRLLTRKVRSKPLTASMIQTPHEVTQLLVAWGNGNQAARDQLMPLVYEELHRLAHRYMGRERVGHTLQTSALVNEGYLRLIDQNQVHWQNRDHFFGIAAQMMRRILVDYARSRGLAKRGGDARQVSLDEAAIVSEERATNVVALAPRSS